MKYGIEIKVGGKWLPVRPPTSPPYSFKTSVEAETMARILHPDLVNVKPEVVRVVPKEV